MIFGATNKETFKVTFYMKSGNKIVLDKVKRTFTFKYNQEAITEISGWGQSDDAKVKLNLGSLNLHQIECFTLEEE